MFGLIEPRLTVHRGAEGLGSSCRRLACSFCTRSTGRSCCAAFRFDVRQLALVQPLLLPGLASWSPSSRFIFSRLVAPVLVLLVLPGQWPLAAAWIAGTGRGAPSDSRRSRPATASSNADSDAIHARACHGFLSTPRRDCQKPWPIRAISGGTPVSSMGGYGGHCHDKVGPNR